MIAKRINHKGQCSHAQTQSARRACRKAMIAALAITEEAPVSRYSIGYVPGRYIKATGRSGPQIEVVYDGNTEIYRTTAAGAAAQYIKAREARDAAPAAEPVAEAKPLPTGWSNAAKRRAGTLIEHPLYGRGVHNAGDGFTTYEGGVQIWDHS